MPWNLILRGVSGEKSRVMVCTGALTGGELGRAAMLPYGASADDTTSYETTPMR